MIMTQRAELDAAFVLHHRPFRDSSLILDVFSREHGRIALVARGVRRPKSKFRGLLVPFRSLLMSWSIRGELGTLTHAEMNGFSSPLTGDGLMSGFYLNELILRLIHRHDPHPKIFRHYEMALAGLREADNISRTLRLFEKRLLEALGYGLNLAQESTGLGALQPQAMYEFKLEHGPILRHRVSDGSSLYSGRSLISLCHEDLNDPVSLRDARRLLQSAIDFYLGDRSLKTRHVARMLQR